MYYTFKDHQGSLMAVVHGNTVERLSHDPWGRRRNPAGFGYDNVSHTFDRGFTGHEHYDKFNLINMNGRLYDPVLGRMLSPDIAIQDEHNAQAYNRYSYCFNNPLRFTDPSGYFVRGSRNYYDWSSFVHYDFGNYRNNGSAFNTDLSEGKFSPVYDVNGYFLGTDDEGLQGEAVVMKREDFRQGMSHQDALSMATDLCENNREEAEIRMNRHYASLRNRPDWDGFVTIDEGIAWAKSHIGALENPTPDNTLYIDANLLDMGFLTVQNSGLKIGQDYTNVNLYDYVNKKSLRSIHTAYALGNTGIRLIDNEGTISFRGDTYDWDYHGNNPFRNTLIFFERARTGINERHGFKVSIYGTTRISKKWPF